MNRIKILNDYVINQIAAGEVVERPASVAKELVENSIDAGATKIEVEISQGGRYIRVSDNGAGIHPDDISLAFSRHATSKINSEKDLWNLNSLGFRGEALASILSISHLTCITKTNASESGTKAVSLDNGELDITNIGCATGTTIEVNDLFYNVPARLKFLRSHKTEVAEIIDILQCLAIAHPEVAFVSKHQNKVLLKTSGSGDLPICLNELFPKDILNHLLMLNAIDEREKLFISGVITDPTFTKPNRKSIFTVINGRFVKCPIILKAVERAYDNKITSGKFPLAVLNLILPTDKVDVNVHPTKREVKYTATNNVFAFINYAVKKALEEGDFYIKKSHSITEDKAKEEALKLIKSHDEQEKASPQAKDFKSKRVYDVPKDRILPSLSHSAFELYTPLEESIVVDDTQNAPIDVVSILNEEETEQLIIHPEIIPDAIKDRKQWLIVGQVFNTYIIIQTDDGIQIIDQHIASERAIYDQLKRKELQIAGQRMLIFEETDVTLEQVALIEEYSDLLKKWSYEIEQTEPGRVIIKQVPHLVTGRNQKEIFEDIVSLLENGHSLDLLEDNLTKTIACHAAIKSGEILTLKEMEQIVSQWQKSDYPYTCPHGRKIAHNITIKELSSYFDRQLNYHK